MKNGNKWLVLAVVELGVLLCSIDSTIVILALPTIATDLGKSIADIQWVSVAYGITCASTLALAGKCADALGRKAAYLIGFAIFTVASLASGLVSDLPLLIALRVFTALGTAFLLSSGNAIITSVFPKEQHGLALGLGATVFSIGVAAGLSLGALILHITTWRWIFLINFPVGLVALAAGAWVFDAKTLGLARQRKQPLDGWGAFFLLTGLASLLLGVEALAGGEPYIPLELVCLSLLLFVLFVHAERRAGDPILPLWLFGVTEVFRGSLMRIMMRMAAGGVTFTLPFYLQRNLGLSPTEAGLLLLANIAVFAVAGPLSGHWSDRWPSRNIISVGLACLSLGILLHLLLPRGLASPDSGILAMVVLAQAIMGLGAALFGSPNAKAALHAVAREHHAVVSGLLWTTTFVGQSLGTAAAAVVLGAAGSNHSGPLQGVWQVFALMAFVAALALYLSLRRQPLKKSYRIVRNDEAITQSPPLAIAEVCRHAHHLFMSGKTRPIKFREQALRDLLRIVDENEAAILTALQQDLGKPTLEAYASEIFCVKSEIRLFLSNLDAWGRDRPVATPWWLWPARSWIRKEPFGCVLILVPWNYPFQLALMPLVAALAAGNTAVIKASELAPVSAALLQEMARFFEPGLVSVVGGGVDNARLLLDEAFDFIFFTGGSAIGKQVALAAAAKGVPCILELGGKNPCIVDESASLAVAARRIVWGKFFNAGQSCLAPDYLYVQRTVYEALLVELAKAITEFYGESPLSSPDLANLVNDRHFERVRGYLQEGGVVHGGRCDAEKCRIEPTLLVDIPPGAKVLTDEIFGPVLPVLPFDDLDGLLAELRPQPTPLAMYLHTRRREAETRVLAQTRSGSVCINDHLMQASVHGLPFGGLAQSGIGCYHGRHGFEAFSHSRAVLRQSTYLDNILRYPPAAGKWPWLRRFLR